MLALERQGWWGHGLYPLCTQHTGAKCSAQSVQPYPASLRWYLQNTNLSMPFPLITYWWFPLSTEYICPSWSGPFLLLQAASSPILTYLPVFRNLCTPITCQCSSLFWSEIWAILTVFSLPLFMFLSHCILIHHIYFDAEPLVVKYYESFIQNLSL